MPNSNFNDLLSIFAALKVRYLIVGGYALMLYCEPKFTKDLDIWVEPQDVNAPIRINLLMSTDGVQFEAA